MPLKVKPLADAAKYWVEGASARQDRYKAEAPAAAEEWERNTIAAAANYKAAVQVGIIDRLFAGGVRRVGGAKFRRKVESVGVDRYRPGVVAGQPDYEAGVAPHLDTLRAITLPERKPRGDPANLDRVKIIAVELHKKRLALRAIS